MTGEEREREEGAHATKPEKWKSLQSSLLDQSAEAQRALPFLDTAERSRARGQEGQEEKR